jgi:hypothetical protein
VKTGSRFDSIWPEMASIGTRSSQAFATGLTRFDDPGPSVERQTPGSPVSCP